MDEYKCIDTDGKIPPSPLPPNTDLQSNGKLWGQDIFLDINIKYYLSGLLLEYFYYFEEQSDFQ